MANVLSKQLEFNTAMKKYHTMARYQGLYKIVSFLNVSLQIVLVYILSTLSVAFIWFLPILFIAYFLTDFLNGLVHLFMDNNEEYLSIFGPFIASFHLHHKTQKYTNNNLLFIYFNESGTKFWLVIYLVLVLFLSFLGINSILLSVLILVGILSSFAEVSHYLCHNSNSKFVRFLQRSHILLSMEHHNIHHNEDNTRYAFLNGMSDFLIDKIAHRFYQGYKKHSDMHYEKYTGNDTANRV